jgi:uncharacterized protein (DUF58 family)
MHLTGRSLLLALVAAVTFIAAQWSADPDIAGLWRAALLLLCGGLAFEAWAQSRIALTARLALPAALYLGRETAVDLRITHGSRRPQRVRLLPLAPAAAPCTAPGEREVRLAPATSHDGSVDDTPSRAARSFSAVDALTLRPVRLGTHRWPVLPARLLGPLGLAWWDRPLDPGATLRVVPDLLRRSGVRTQAPAAGARPRPLQESAREVHRWREWQPGDPLSRVDWKVTARSGVITARELRDDQHLEVLLAIDAGCESATGDDLLDALGTRVNLAARLAESALARGDRVGLLVFSDRVLRAVPPLGGMAALPRLRGQLAALAPDDQPADADGAAHAALGLLRHRGGAVLWFGEPPSRALPALAARHSVVAMLPRVPAVEAFLDAPPGVPRRFWAGLAAERRLAADRVLADRLRSSGVAVVSEAPARLEAAVWTALTRGSRASRRAR